MKMKRFFGSSLILVCLAFLQGCSQEQPPETAEKIRPAKLITVKKASVQQELSFPAVIQAAQSAELTFQISGEIRELNVLESDLVQRGDVIAQLDQSDTNSRLLQVQAEYDNAQAEFKRAQRLYDQDAISRSVLDNRRTQRDVAHAALETSEKALRNTTLKAPFSGRISRVLIRQYQNVQAKEPIVILHSNEVEAVMNAPSAIVTRARQIESFNTRVILDAAPDQPIVAEYKEVAGEADQATQTYPVSLSFVPPEDLLILPGMTATVELDLRFTDASGVAADGVAVPLSSILAEGDNKYVWLVSENGDLHKRAVAVQHDASGTVTVLEGLSPGDTIIAAGTSFFYEGMKVRPWTPD